MKKGEREGKQQGEGTSTQVRLKGCGKQGSCYYCAKGGIKGINMVQDKLSTLHSPTGFHGLLMESMRTLWRLNVKSVESMDYRGSVPTTFNQSMWSLRTLHRV